MIQDAVIQRLKAVKAREAYPISQLRPTCMHEGEEMFLLREDGTREKIAMKQITGIFAVEDKEIPSLTPQALVQKIDSAAKEMATKGFA